MSESLPDSQPKPAPPARLIRAAWIVWALTLLIALGFRVLGPSDLGQNLDQSKTIAFTLDMVHNGRWALPRDGLGEATRKPPMVNWLGAPAVALGLHSEPALKLPALLSGVATALLIIIAGRVLLPRLALEPADDCDAALAMHTPAVALLASSAWLASISSVKHIYFMRPDILFTALLTGAWVVALVLLAPRAPRHARRWALLLWALGAGAILTKGPLALVLPAYLLLHIILITPRGQRAQMLSRLGWWWGWLVLIAPPLIWLYFAHQTDAEHVRRALLGEELGSRVGRGGLGGIFETAAALPGYLAERFAPWSILAILAIVFPPSARLRRHPMGPATLWALCVLGATVLFAMNSGSYMMPAYPALALLGVYALCRIVATKTKPRMDRAIRFTAALALLCVTLVALREATVSRGAKDRTGEHLKAFARQAQQIVADDPVLFERMGDLPVPSLMGRSQPGEIVIPGGAQWVIRPTQPNPQTTLELTSEPIVTHDPDTGIPNDGAITLGLYRYIAAH